MTFYYRSPEIFLGNTNYGIEVDIWGIGIIFYELINRQ